MFSTEIFLPRGHAYLWTPWLIIAEIAGNAVIALALVAVGVRLVRRVRSGDPEALVRGAAWMGLLAFALAATHLLDVWVIWTPIYGIDVVVRAAAALIAIAAAFKA
jgi:predicted permease